MHSLQPTPNFITIYEILMVQQHNCSLKRFLQWNEPTHSDFSGFYCVIWHWEGFYFIMGLVSIVIFSNETATNAIPDTKNWSGGLSCSCNIQFMQFQLQFQLRCAAQSAHLWKRFWDRCLTRYNFSTDFLKLK